MSLTVSTLLTGIFVFVLGGLFLTPSTAVASVVKGFPRSRTAGYILFAAGVLWFLWKVLHLGQADFGDYKHWLFMGFAAVGILSFWMVPDFLSIRGSAILVLLAADPILNSAFMRYEQPQRLLMVTVVFVFIALAIWWGAQPYRMRDFLGWLYRSTLRRRMFGLGLATLGVLLVAIAISY